MFLDIFKLFWYIDIKNKKIYKISIIVVYFSNKYQFLKVTYTTIIYIHYMLEKVIWYYHIKKKN
jgi:hypothetical protein